MSIATLHRNVEEVCPGVTVISHVDHFLALVPVELTQQYLDIVDQQ